MMELLSGRGIEIAIATAGVAVVAVAGGVMTDVGDWYESLTFPRLRPPNWLFGPAWTVIFVLIAASGVIAWEHAESADRARLIALFAINGVLNVLWSPLFFKLRRPDWAFYELIPFWLSVLALVLELSRISTVAGWLIAPYLVWVSFAGWLNWHIVQLNKPFGRRALSSSAPGKVRGNGRVAP
jgi:translocator protein